jgi:anaerobic sulfite reductase subunit C
LEMQWSKEARDALRRVPFFVRKRVKARVEEEARTRGEDRVTLHHVMVCKRRFLERMEEEVKGFQVETCFGPGGCPNRAVKSDGMAEDLKKLLASGDMRGFLEKRVGGPLKFHHEFRISISDCPNACSRPHIVDIGLIGAAKPRVGETPCSGCGACVEACRESALTLEAGVPILSEEKCLSCGVCVGACPTGTLEETLSGYRVLLGGKLGRHPRLGEEIPGIHDIEEVHELVRRCLDGYRDHCERGERLGAILERLGMETFFGKSEKK